ncbi:leucine-rich repeat- and IQ domain-containing protein 1 [Leuresthes tenuis]|uniref:leucine-rich repeat- and IQ domain-containing protein 1 n=1 Tax=Leuresthes tenuis TaxID=355514 RepID=UPI003B50CD89
MTDDEYMENDLALEISEHEAQREKHHSEEVQKEEQRRQREMDFQQELRKIMEEEKLHQMKLELMKKRAREKLEQELLLQQELICNLQKRVEYERRMIEEEWKRKKEEEAERKAKEKEERRKREEEDKRRRQEDRKEMEEEKKRKIIDMRLKEKEDKRKREEQRKRKEEYDEKRKSEEEKDKREREMRKKEEERKTQEIKFREEEMRRRVEEEINEGKEERRVEKSESRIKWKTEKEETKEKEERLLLEVAVKKISQGEKRRNEHKLNPKNELRKMEGEEGKKRDEGEKRGETELRIGKKTEVRTKREEGDEQKSEEERENGELERKSMDEDLIRMKDGSGKMEKKMQVRDDEGKKRDEEKGKSVEKKDMVRTEEEKTANTQTKWHEVEKKNKEEECRHTEEEIRLKQEIQDNKECAGDTREVEHERKEEDKDKWQDDLKKLQKKEDETKRTEADMRHSAEEVKEDKEEEMKMEEIGLKEETGDREGKKESEEERMLISENEVEEKKENNKLIFQNKKTGRTELWSSSSPGPSLSESTGSRTCSETVQNHLLDKNICPASACETMGQQESVIKCCTSSCSVPVSLPEHTEQKRLSWMKDCMPWSKLSLQNTRKQKGSVWSLRRPRKAAGASRLPPLCPNTLLQSSGFKSLQEVTTVTLEELPGCSLSTLVHCHQLRSLTLRRCGLKSLEGISQLQELCYIDLRENDISSVDCERMTSLRVLRLAHNKLTSIHGLSGADSLSVLDLSHNSITRIAGLESVSRLQRLSVDHNQLISTKGLRDVYTLLHLDCSHNHLTSVEGLENSALLHTLDLKSNSLTEPPSLNNQVLLREVHLDDNSISSLQGLAACWLPLMQNLSVAQNRITQLPSMIDFVSLENLDLRLNCLSELPNVCENLKGCHFLREVHLSGNPLQQERGWRSTLQKALPGLRAIDSQQTDSFLSVLPAQQVNMVPGCFLTFCQAQLQQTLALEQRHSKELGNASSPLDAVKSFCRHFTVAQKLAEDQRFAHEYGDTTASAEYLAEGHTTAEKELNIDLKTAESCIYYPEMDTNSKQTAVFPNKNNMRCSYSGYEETPAEESLRDTFDIVATDPRTGSAVSKTNSGTLPVFTSNGEKTSFSLDKVFVSSFHDLDLKNTAAVLIQRRWRKYRLKCGNVDPSIVEKEGEIRGDGEKPESGPSYINRSAAGRDYAATVIQAFWRGFTLRRRLAYALAAVTWPDAGEEDAFEEVDVEEFVFDEPALEKYWTVTFSEDSPPRHRPVSEQPLSQKPPVSSHDYSEYLCSPPLVQSPKQAWMAGQHVDSVVQRISPKSSNRDQSPAPSSVLSGLSERSEKILEEWGFTDSRTALLMLKRAQKMKSAKKQQKKNRNPSLGLAMFRKEARKSPAQYNRYSLKVGEAELGLQLAERTEQTRREQAQHRLHTQAAQSDRHSESEHFLPEINSSILNGGRVQLVADAACADRPHATGLWANSSLADQPGKVNTYSGRNSSGHARKEVASPKRVTSAPSKKERISFRDHPVQLSGGWGGGKKRDRLHK